MYYVQDTVWEQYLEWVGEFFVAIKINHAGLINYVNETFCQKLWYKKEEVLGEPISVIRDPDMPFEVVREMWETLKAKQKYQWVMKNITKNWESFRTNTLIKPILDETSDIKEFIFLWKEIKEENEEAKEKDQVIEKLEEINKVKDDFLNIASHELRTPLTSIKSYASLILDEDCGEINDEIRMYLEKIFNNSQRLINMVNDMLDIHKLEAWKMEITYKDFDMWKLVIDVYQDMQQIAGKKNQKIFLNNEIESFYVRSDYDKLYQVLTNLINNAIKFTPEKGEIQLNFYKENKNICIEVVDNWIWISENEKKQVFEKFGQVKNSWTRSEWGTGLWLPIVKAILERIWGDIVLESEKWKWTKFIVKHPV